MRWTHSSIETNILNTKSRLYTRNRAPRRRMQFSLLNAVTWPFNTTIESIYRQQINGLFVACVHSAAQTSVTQRKYPQTLRHSSNFTFRMQTMCTDGIIHDEFCARAQTLRFPLDLLVAAEDGFLEQHKRNKSVLFHACIIII